jgi:hypothetical protein
LEVYYDVNKLILNDYRKFKDGHANFLVIPLIANPQILVLTPQSQILTFLRLASPKSKISKLVMIKGAQV